MEKEKIDLLQFGEMIKGHKLFDDTYLFEYTKCLVIAKVDASGNIVKVSRFGHRKEAD